MEKPRSLRKLLIFTVCMVFILSLFMPLVAYADDADIINFPDANLKQALLDAGVDTSGDGQISKGILPLIR